MIKTVVIPDKNIFNLKIPSNYIGRKIEILFYALDEVLEDEKVKSKMKPSDFFGTLTEEDGTKFNNYVTKTRQEWERSI